jgi:hypothetical protein
MLKVLLTIMQLGRSDNIHLISCGHLLDVLKGKMDLNECTHIVLYPTKMAPHHVRSYIDKFITGTKKESAVSKVYNMIKDQRVVTIMKHQPPILIMQNRIEVLN